MAELGEFEEAETWAREGLALSGQVRNHFSTGFVQACIGLAYLRKGDLNTALDLLLKANTMNREADMQSIFSFVAGSLGNVYLLLKQPEKALPILTEAVDHRFFNSSVIPAIYTINALSEAHRLCGQIDKAIETSEKALKIYRETAERTFGAWTLYTAAKIQSDNHQEQQAVHTLHQANILAETLKMKPLLTHCYFELGRLSLDKKSEDARSSIFKAIDLYRSLGMKLWLPEAEDLLRKIA